VTLDNFAPFRVGAILSITAFDFDPHPVSTKIHRVSHWGAAVTLYALAKLLEHYDRQIYSFGGVLSGHTLKHLAAASACFAILKLFQVRRPLKTFARSD
jgi:hypothetical protein